VNAIGDKDLKPLRRKKLAVSKRNPTVVAVNNDILKVYIGAMWKSGYVVVIHQPYDYSDSGNWVDKTLDVWTKIETIPDYIFLHFKDHSEAYELIKSMPRMEVYGTLWACLDDRTMWLGSNT
jgi:hypothetical protein